ncbi:hypothetical protein BGZ73_008393 [Actinomortierella ambigua]|nr:hypothetical protein BGZ73_008393 [Actinomortierella ambigua]
MPSLTIGHHIGSGAYGAVFHARWGVRKVAIKKFNLTRDEAKHEASVQAEIKLLERLRDRHIVQFYGDDYHEDKLVLIMDYADGGSLQSAIKRRQVSDWPTRTRIAHEIAQGLAYIHQENILHRDLKSGNVLLTRHKEVKLCDFGLAKVKLGSVSGSTASGDSLKGTFRWMAPELFSARPKYSSKSDMYALGMVLWEMAANNTTPFEDQPDNYVVMGLVKSGHVGPAEDESTGDTVSISMDFSDMSISLSSIAPSDTVTMSNFSSRSTLSTSSSSSSTGTTNKSTSASVGNERLMTDSEQTLLGDEPQRPTPVQKQPESKTKARSEVDILSARAESGDVDAQLALANMYATGVGGVGRDDTTAVDWYARAAQGRPLEVKEEEEDVKEEEEKEEQEKDNGEEEEEEEWLGRVEWPGEGEDEEVDDEKDGDDDEEEEGKEDGGEEDEGQRRGGRRDREGGNAEAQNALGVMIYDGRGTASSSTEAIYWFRRAAEQGHLEAHCNLGAAYAVDKQNYPEAEKWFLKAAEMGYADAQARMGQMNMDRATCWQDIKRASSWFQKAADQNHAGAQYRLGILFESGMLGHPKSEVKAAAFYQKAALQSHRAALLKLGTMYQLGKGVPRSRGKYEAYYAEAKKLEGQQWDQLTWPLVDY